MTKEGMDVQGIMGEAGREREGVSLSSPLLNNKRVRVRNTSQEALGVVVFWNYATLLLIRF